MLNRFLQQASCGWLAFKLLGCSNGSLFAEAFDEEIVETSLRPEMKPLDTCTQAGIKVGNLVANHDRPRGISSAIAQGLDEHPRIGFAVGVIDETVAFDGALCVIGTIVEGINTPARCRHGASDVGVKPFDVLLGMFPRAMPD